MSKLILGNIIRHLITLLIAFFVARNMLAEDVARKLYAGDTVELWNGAWSISIKQVVDFLILSAIPVLIPIGHGIWARIKDKYRVLVARLSPEVLSAGEVNAIVENAPKAAVIKAVASAHPGKIQTL